MSLQTNPAVEEESKLVKLLGLIKKERFGDAKEYADELRNQGVSEPIINHFCYDYFRRLAYHKKEKAEELAKFFRDYHWKAWLI
ncbi:hypothetical protein DRN73_02040 [Candidatus Pacearchaeota archaeon]|nr:MAG: hypothetical protein DRN73_02040 [Candidatus Pacearchaeota archaeon]